MAYETIICHGFFFYWFLQKLCLVPFFVCGLLFFFFVAILCLLSLRRAQTISSLSSIKSVIENRESSCASAIVGDLTCFVADRIFFLFVCSFFVDYKFTSRQAPTLYFVRLSDADGNCLFLHCMIEITTFELDCVPSVH